MALNISEIGIRLTVGDTAPPPPHQSDAAPRPSGHGPSLAPHEIDELVRKCVADVLAALRGLGER